MTIWSLTIVLATFSARHSSLTLANTGQNNILSLSERMISGSCRRRRRGGRRHAGTKDSPRPIGKREGGMASPHVAAV